ncbi:glycoside hydrolase family 3 N-terminal domain-containing protein [Actinopolymorpha sp. B9G3]|uniref:glycoside hydrolase family 3 protein n=3 Tax=unclassified Actinopolymorpha TaxID=2627063 RepID=UPI0032D90FF8
MPEAARRKSLAARVLVPVLAIAVTAGCGALGLGGDAGGPGVHTPSADRTSKPSRGSASGRSPAPPPPSLRVPTPGPTPTPGRKAAAPAALPWGPTKAEWARARRIVGHMSLGEKAGQVIVAGFDGTSAPLSLLRRHHVGGVIVMGNNVASTDQVRDVNRALQDEARRLGRSWPVVIGVDQEGGRVARVKGGLTEFPAYMTLGAARDAGLARTVARASGKELRDLGFTMVFAPDADVTTGPDDPTIGSRSAGSDPSVVASTVKGSLRGYAEAGIVAVPKHFPGHGSVPADSHVSLPVQEASLAELRRRDLVPFKAAVGAGAQAVMVAHIDVRAVDAGAPSSVSGPVIGGMLRERLGFSGVVVTDALEMAGVAEKYGSADAGVRALLAGADILLLPADAGASHTAVVRAVRSGRLPQARLDAAAARSIALMLHQRASVGADPLSAAALGGSSRASYTASLRGLTVASGPCRGRLVGSRVQVIGGDREDRERFAAAARDADLDVTRSAAEGAGGAGDVVRLLDTGWEQGSGDVVVALDTPYGLGGSRAEKARIALYGRTPAAFQALVDVLTGRARGTGRLPVDVDGLPPRAGCPR